MNKVERKSNFELLKIIAMLAIIMFHYVYKSGYSVDILTPYNVFIKSVWFFGEIGVNLFMLITGYFMIKSKFSYKKLVSFILEVNFYFVITLLVGYYLDLIPLNYSIDFYILPIILNKYWFITAYILVYIFSPYINKMIRSLKKSEMQSLILKAIIIWSIIPTIIGILYNSTETILYYNRFIWLVIVYIIGAYLQLYKTKILSNNKNNIFIIIILSLILILTIPIIYIIKTKFNILHNVEIAYFWPPNSILIILLSIAIFSLFKNIEIKSNMIINKLASTTLAIYIMHDSILCDQMWLLFFKSRLHIENGKYYHILISAIFIFLLGACIELFRKHVIKLCKTSIIKINGLIKF